MSTFLSRNWIWFTGQDRCEAINFLMYRSCLPKFRASHVVFINEVARMGVKPVIMTSALSNQGWPLHHDWHFFPIWLPSSEDNISGFFPLDFSPLELFSFYYVASIPCLKALAIDSLLTMISILYLTIVTFLELILQTKFEHKFMLRSF